MDFLVFFVTRLLGLFISLAIIIYILLALRIVLIHPYVVYLPHSRMGNTPGEIGLEYRDIFFKTKDGVTLNAWFIPARDPRATVLHCHGNAGNISERLDRIKIYYDMGISFFIFDYRGYGMSNGKPFEKGTYRDAEAAWNYLTGEMGIEPGNIIIDGHSLGGAIASYLAAKVTPRALIVEGSFTTITDMGKLIYPYLPIRLLMRQRYNTREYITRVHCPVLVIHSPDDRVVPFYMGQVLYQAANPPKEFLRLQGSHNDAILDCRELYIQKVSQLIADSDHKKNNK